MKWVTVSHISNNLEVNNKGKIRYKDSKKEVTITYNSMTGFYEADLATDGYGRSNRRNIHTIVARYFLNNGKKISNYKKVIFKNGDYTDYSASNLEITQKNQHIGHKSNKKDIDLFVNYGDEIYC